MTRSRSSSSGPTVGELTVTVELTSAPDEPDRTIVGFLPFDTQRVELPFELDIDTGSDRRPVGRAGLHADPDRRADPRRADGRPEHRRHRHDRARRHGRGDRRAAPEGVGRRPGRGRRVHRAGGAGRGRTSTRARRAGGDGLRIIPVATVDEALAALEELGGVADRRGPDCHQRTSPECLRWAAWPSRSRDPTRRRPRLSPRRSSRPPAVASTTTRCATCCAASRRAAVGSRSARSTSSASCAPPSRAPSTAPTARRRDRRPPARRGDVARAADRPRERVADQDPRRGGRRAHPARGHRGRQPHARAGRDRGVAQAHRCGRRRRGRGFARQAAGPRDGQRSARLPRAGAVGADPPARVGAPADRAADPRPRPAAAGVRAGPPGCRRRGVRAHAARRARGVRRPVADHRPGADDGARPLVDDASDQVTVDHRTRRHRCHRRQRRRRRATRAAAEPEAGDRRRRHDADDRRRADGADVGAGRRRVGSGTSMPAPVADGGRAGHCTADATAGGDTVGERGRAVPRQGRRRGPSRHRCAVRPPASGRRHDAGDTDAADDAEPTATRRSSTAATRRSCR